MDITLLPQPRLRRLLMENVIMIHIQVPWFTFSILGSLFFSPLAGNYARQTFRLTAALLYEGEGDDWVTAYGRAAWEISPHQSEWRENLLTGSSPEPLHTPAHEIFNRHCWQDIGFLRNWKSPFFSRVNAFSAGSKAACFLCQSSVCCTCWGQAVLWINPWHFVRQGDERFRHFKLHDMHIFVLYVYIQMYIKMDHCLRDKRTQLSTVL